MHHHPRSSADKRMHGHRTHQRLSHVECTVLDAVSPKKKKKKQQTPTNAMNYHFKAKLFRLRVYAFMRVDWGGKRKIDMVSLPSLSTACSRFQFGQKSIFNCCFVGHLSSIDKWFWKKKRKKKRRTSFGGTIKGLWSVIMNCTYYEIILTSLFEIASLHLSSSWQFSRVRTTWRRGLCYRCHRTNITVHNNWRSALHKLQLFIFIIICIPWAKLTETVYAVCVCVCMLLSTIRKIFIVAHSAHGILMYCYCVCCLWRVATRKWARIISRTPTASTITENGRRRKTLIQTHLNYDGRSQFSGICHRMMMSVVSKMSCTAIVFYAA